jgi:hypothetical protein
MAANKRVEKLLDQKSKIERELRLMQDKCMHTSRTIKQVTLGEGCQTSTRWVCNGCSLVVGYPSEEELKEYLK